MRAAFSSFIALRTLAVARGFAPHAARAARVPSHGAAADSIEIDGNTFTRVRVAVTDALALDVFEADAATQDALVERACEPDLATAAGGADPYGAVLWPAALAVARRCTEIAPETLAAVRVLELGAGTGLASRAAAACGARTVLATDYEPLPLRLLSAADAGSGRVATQLFDVADHSAPLPPGELVLIADLLYDKATARALAKRVDEAYRRGARVIVGDSPGRPGRETFLTNCRARLPPEAATTFAEVDARRVTGPRHELICGDGSTSVARGGGDAEPLPIALLDLIPPGWPPERCPTS